MTQKVDVVPELIQNIKQSLQEAIQTSQQLRILVERLKFGDLSFADSHAFAIELGKLLSQALNHHITLESLPNETIYFNIINRVLSEFLGEQHERVALYTTSVMESLNRQANLSLKVITPPLNTDRIKGLANKAVETQNLAWIGEAPIVNFSQAIVDKAIDLNAQAHEGLGLKPIIVRRSTSKPCEWCANLAGVYNYDSAPSDVYHRHENCRCLTTYTPAWGKRKEINVWTKK